MTAPRHLAIMVLSLVVLGAVAPHAAVRDAKIIANNSVTVASVSEDELKGILLTTRTSLADGAHLEPVLLKSGRVHDALIRDLLGKTASGLDSYYRSLVFAGKGAMPRRFSTEAELVAYVRATKGAIGYVSPDTPTDGVKILEVK